MSLIIPSTFDRADGLNGNPGTPIPQGVNMANGGLVGINSAGNSGFIFQEYPDSPTIECGEQSTITHRFNCDIGTAQLLTLTLPRGFVMTDSQGYVSRVLSTVNKQLKGGLVCDFTVVSEVMSFSTPPDEFGIEIVELNPDLDKHPRYAPLTYYDRWAVRNANLSDDIDVALEYERIIDAIEYNPANPSEKDAAQELLLKKHKGETSFYLSGYKVVWSQYFWQTQIINPGGYLEDPVSQGGLPWPYWSPTGISQIGSIFSTTTLHNANMFIAPTDDPPYGLSWLRQTDQLSWQRTWYKLTKTWIGGPLGVWDAQLYSTEFQEYQTESNEGDLILG